MTHAFEARRICDGVFWVGAIDWNLRDFHGYLTSRGTTYNAYLVMGEYPTLIDTVKAPFFDEMMSRISSVVDPSRIEYVVSNHAEMDHSGCLQRAVAAVKPSRVFASKKGIEALGRHFGTGLDLTEAVSGGSLDAGGMTLHFMDTPMLHWPDSMFTWLVQRGLLFSQDAFGMHLASYERFADELPDDVLEFEAAKYFANILTPFSKLVLNLLDKVSKSGMQIELIAPDHGPVWRRDASLMQTRYSSWARRKPSRKAVVVFDTMWNSTQAMARAVAEGLGAAGAEVRVCSLKTSHRSDIATELLDAGAIAIGTPTMNNMMFPTVADLLCYVKGLKFQNLVGAAFGSYGWSGEGAKSAFAQLIEMKADMVGEPLAVKYVPDDGDLARCRELGAAVAAKLPD